jgi:hypothetical protein
VVHHHEGATQSEGRQNPPVVAISRPLDIVAALLRCPRIAASPAPSQQTGNDNPHGSGSVQVGISQGMLAMNAAARPWIGLFFKISAFLALIIAFIFFMKMQEEQSANDKLRNQGVVSRALVTEKKQDTTTTQHSGMGRRSSGYTTENDIWVLTVRHVPKSTVKFADFPSRVKEADLPVAPPVTGDPLKDSGNIGIMWVSKELYDRARVGDILTVVNTPWDSESPVLVSEVEAFDPSPYYPRMAIALFLMVLFWFIGRRISKAPALQGLTQVSGIAGTLP